MDRKFLKFADTKSGQRHRKVGKVEKILNYLKKSSSIVLNREIMNIDMIGEIQHPFPSKYIKIKSTKSIFFPSQLAVNLAYLSNKESIIITEPEKQSLVTVDLDGNYISSCNPDGLLQSPGAICISNKNEIYIEDYYQQTVFVFDAEFNLLRKFGDERLEAPFYMAIDDETNFLYVSDYLNNRITVWNGVSGLFINEQYVNTPLSMHVRDEKLYVLSSIDIEAFNMMNTKFDTEDNENQILVLDKNSLKELKAVPINTCLHPKGIFVDEALHIFTTAYEIESAKNKDSKSLFKLDENGKCLSKVKLGISGVFNMLILTKKIAYTRGFRTPPAMIFEFQ